MNEDMISLLLQVKEKFTDDSDMLWTSYDTAEEVRQELESYIAHIGLGDTSCMERLGGHFAPTSTFQEHAIQNGWTDEYMMLASRFDTFYMEWKKS